MWNIFKKITTEQQNKLIEEDNRLERKKKTIYRQHDFVLIQTLSKPKAIKDIPWSCIRRHNIVKTSSFPKAMYGFITIEIKILVSFCGS